MAKAQTERTYTTPELRLRVTVWVVLLPTGNRYDVLLERGGASWRFKSEHVKLAADNVTPRHLGVMLQTAVKMFPAPMHDLLLEALREADANLRLDADRCHRCPVSGTCKMCGWTDGGGDDGEL